MSIKLEVTEDIARAALLAAVDAQGADHVNPRVKPGGCALTDPATSEHCVVGEALAILGVKLPVASLRSNTLNVLTFGSERLQTHLERRGVTFTPEAAYLLRRVQAQADTLISWGKVLERHGVTR